MRLVYVIPSIQHPLVRGPTRHYYFLRELAQRHDITLLTLEREKIPHQALEEVTAYTEALYSFPADIGLSIQASRRWLPSPEGSRLQRAWRVGRGLRAMKRLFRAVVAAWRLRRRPLSRQDNLPSAPGCADQGAGDGFL
jgi:hypothetical protein